MMNTMRALAGGIGAKIMLALLIVSFGVWGIEDMLRSQRAGGPVATVGKHDISPIAFQRAYAREQERARAALGSNYSPEMLRMMGLSRQVLDKLITEDMLAQEVQALGLRVSDAEVAKDIRQEPFFQSEKGVFDKNQFEETLRRNGFSEQAYAADVRRNHAVSLLMESVQAGKPISSVMISTLMQAMAEERTADLVTLTPSDVKEIPAPDDSAAEAYYKAHLAEFTLPETRSVSYVTVEAEDLLKDTPVPEEELKKAYAERAAFFGDKAEPYEKVRSALEKEWKTAHADEALNSFSTRLEDLLAGGSTLEEAAKEMNITVKSVGPFDRGGALAGKNVTLPTLENFVETAFRTDENTDSAFTRGAAGTYYLVHVDKVTPEQAKPFESVKETAVAGVKKQETAKKLQSLAQSLAEKMKEAKDAGKAAEKEGFKVSGTGTLRRNSTKTLNNRPLPSTLVSELFTLAPGEITKPYPADGGSMMIGILRKRIASPKSDEQLAKDPQVKAMADALEDAMRQEISEAYIDYLRGKYHVKINESALVAFEAEPEQ